MKKNNNECNNQDIKLKANFLGPKAENASWLRENIDHIFMDWANWRNERFPSDSSSISQKDLQNPELKKTQEHIFKQQKELSSRFESEIPKYSPRYMGHMVSEISLAALFGHIVALLHNPNNSSLSASKVGSLIEQEAIDELSKMIGFNTPGVGHFTSGGTIANIEAIWRARFRLDHSISLGAYENDKENKKHTLFEASHLSIDGRVNKKETIPYSFVQLGPYKTFNLYKKLFNTNFEGPILIISAHKHYSWQKAVSLLGLGKESLWSVQLDNKGHMCIKDLKRKIELAKKSNRPILAVVSVAGTTELGMIDPVHEVQNLLDQYKRDGLHIWHHVDAAYGGIYSSIVQDSNLSEKTELTSYCQNSLQALKRVESITLDPHKLAMVPYACGAILVKDEQSYPVSEFYAPYLKEKPLASGKWVSTIEGSRPATGASATWMVAKTIGLNKDGMGRILEIGLSNKKMLIENLKKKVEDINFIPQTDTNIICFTFLDKERSIKKANLITRKIYEKIGAEDKFSVSQTTLNRANYKRLIEHLEETWKVKEKSNDLYLVRMVIMNPFSNSKENKFNYMKEYSSYLANAYIDLKETN